MLTMDQAKQLLATTTTQEHLFLHAKNVSVAMGGIARHLGADDAHWEAIGYLHDYDYEQFPEEHLQHTEQPLLAAGLSGEEVRAILAHGYGHINDVTPVTDMEKALFTVDEPAVVIETVKLAEDRSGDLIVRLYESMNGSRRVTFRSAFAPAKVWRCNMLEEAEEELTVQDGAVMFDVRPFEIVTLRLKKAE